MAGNECIPYYDDGDHISGYCDVACQGKRFVKINDTRSGGTFDSTSVTAGDGGVPHIAPADAGGRIHGVAAYDGVVSAIIDVIRGSKMVVPVVAGSALDAGDEVAVGIDGTAVAAGSETAVAATLVTGTVGAKNAILWTAKASGTEGEGITIRIAAAATGHPAKSVEVSGEDITVYVTVSTTTAAEVIAAVTADDAASDLVTAENDSTSDGTGVMAAVSKTPLAGGAEGGRADQAVGYVLADCAAGADAQVSLY